MEKLTQKKTIWRNGNHRRKKVYMAYYIRCKCWNFWESHWDNNILKRAHLLYPICIRIQISVCYHKRKISLFASRQKMCFIYTQKHSHTNTHKRIIQWPVRPFLSAISINVSNHFQKFFFSSFLVSIFTFHQKKHKKNETTNKQNAFLSHSGLNHILFGQTFFKKNKIQKYSE